MGVEFALRYFFSFLLVSNNFTYNIFGAQKYKKKRFDLHPKKLFFESQLENILKPLAVLRVRDVEGAEGGAKRSASGV